MKLVVDANTDKVLGAAMCGPDAPEIMQVWAFVAFIANPFLIGKRFMQAASFAFLCSTSQI